MANQIAEKLKLLNCPPDMMDNALKFSASLTLVSLEELKEIIDYLTEKGVVASSEGKILLSPKAFKILPRGLDFIKERVGEMEELGELDCYKEKPYRITILGSYDRLKWMKEHNEVYKTEDNKYSMLIFSKVAFETKYGKVDFNQAEEAKANEVPEVQVVEETPEVKAEETLDTVVDVPTTEEPKAEEVPTFEAPVEAQMAAPVETPEEVTETIEDTVPILDALPSADDLVEEKTEEAAEVLDTAPVTPEEPLDAPLDEDRFNKLKGYLNTLYVELFGLNGVPDDMLECLKVFMKETDFDDHNLIYELLTSGSDYPEEAKAQISEAITDVINRESGLKAVA